MCRVAGSERFAVRATSTNWIGPGIISFAPGFPAAATSQRWSRPWKCTEGILRNSAGRCTTSIAWFRSSRSAFANWHSLGSRPHRAAGNEDWKGESMHAFWTFILTCILAAGLSTSCYAAANERDLKEDKEQAPKTDGTWQLVEAELAGQKLPEEITKSITLTLKGDQYTVVTGEGKD